MPRRSMVEDETQEKARFNNSKDELRRVRNRQSQRAIREKRALRIQQLEQELAQTRQNDAETQCSELRAENERLRNGLHATRKKLLSISTTSSSVADSILSLFNLDPGNDELEKDNISSQMMPIEESPASSELPQESPSTEEIVLEQQPGLKDLFPDQFTPALDLRDLAVKTTTFSDRTQQLESEIWALPEADGALVLSSKRSVSNFSDHLDYIFKLLGLSGISEHFSSAPLLIHSLLHCFIQQCWPVMDHWFQITDSCAVMKTVMWWQTTKSPQSFIDMLDGYSPTPVQLVLSYPCIIDWIPHPTIRNVMVTNYEMYDVDQVICDMTDAYVVENQHSVENTKPESCNVMEMVQRYPPSAEDARITQLYANLDTSRFHPRSQFLQTHHIQGFKIDPSFFVKYPGLYDATAIAKTSCSSIRIHERVEVKHRPLPFTAASASKYLDMVTQAKANAFQ